MACLEPEDVEQLRLHALNSTTSENLAFSRVGTFGGGRVSIRSSMGSISARSTSSQIGTNPDIELSRNDSLSSLRNRSRSIDMSSLKAKAQQAVHGCGDPDLAP